MANGYGIEFIETSAKTGLNVDVMFDKILEKTYNFKFGKTETAQPEPEQKQSIKITAKQEVAPKKKDAGGCAC